MISFSVFGEVPLKLSSRAGTEEVSIENSQRVQLPHVSNMQRHLTGELQHPSTGASATHTA